jgi:hypothetical protein
LLYQDTSKILTLKLSKEDSDTVNTLKLQAPDDLSSDAAQFPTSHKCIDISFKPQRTYFGLARNGHPSQFLSFEIRKGGPSSSNPEGRYDPF